jgi:hypothetical protein
VAMSDVRVLLIQGEGRVHQYVQVGYTGAASRFAWIYPVAGNPEVSEVATSPFAALDEVARPHVYISTPHSGGGGGCGFMGAAADSKSGGNQAIEPPVKVWQSGQVGAFDYVVISARAAQDLLDWLQQNGFAIPDRTAPVLEHYLSINWLFVAMKISVQTVGAQVPATTVLRLSYPATELRYPLRMISLSPSSATRFEIYLLTSQGVQPSGPFSTLTIPSEQLRATSASTSNYEDVFDGLIKLQPRGLVWEYSSRGWTSAGWSTSSSTHYQLAQLSEDAPSSSLLTRFRAVLGPAEMTQDLLFENAGTVERQQSYYLSWNQSVEAGLPAPLVLLALACAAGGLLRRLRRKG